MLCILLGFLVFPFSSFQDVPAVDKAFLQGAWTDDLEANALFYIEGDSIFYLEDRLKGYHYDLDDHKLSIAFDGFVSMVTIKVLDKDSMVFLNEESEPETILYRVP